LGGLTARLLDTLLKLGDPAERGDGGTAAAGVNAGAMSQLFEGGKPWVESVTAISSPHDGTTLTSEYHEVGSIRKLFAKWLAVSSVKREKPILDLHLDHWESAAADGESLSDFLRRAVDEELWRDIEDFSIYDLSPAGARRLNRRTRLDPRSYYFSLGSSSTVPDPETGYHVPAKGTSLPLHPNARFMGSLRTLPEGAEGTPALWWENDGVVNTCSMDGPSLGTAQPVEKYRGEPVRGVWNHLATLHPCDHWQMHVAAPLLGNSPPGYESLVDFYAAQASLLRSL
jgi:triacylglycerol lipase